MTTLQLLDRLKGFYGKTKPPQPTDPFGMVLHRNAGYPPSDERCDKGFQALQKEIGITPSRLLAASDARLAAALKGSGMNAELRARRLKQCAVLVREEFAGDLRSALKLPLPEARKALKRFPTIGEPSIDKILLFTKTAPVAAIPSNSVHVLARLGFAKNCASYPASYRSAQDSLQRAVPESIPARLRAYLLLKVHGETLCTRNRPRCSECPVSAYCAYFRSNRSSGS